MPSQIEKKTVFYKWNMKLLLHSKTFQPIIKSSEGEKSLPTMHRGHRFSAFWLRSKCSICSYQLNIWYGLHSRSRILNWFLTDWAYGWACSPGPAGRHGIALPPWVASSFLWIKPNYHIAVKNISQCMVLGTFLTISFIFFILYQSLFQFL